jgi:hypothetical protein
MKEARHLRRQGAVLVFALLIVVVASTIYAGMAQLAVTQSVAGQAEWVASARRIQLENSRALARQYILAQMWRDFGSLSTAALSLAGTGGFSLTSVDPEVGFWLSTRQDVASRVNPFNLFERGGFQSAWVNGTLQDGSSSIPWGFQIRTRSPIVAGFAFVNHRPAENVWAPARRMDLRQNADYAVGFPALPRPPVSSITNTSIAPAAVTMTDLGFLRLPKAEANFGNILLEPMTNSVMATTNNLPPEEARLTLDLDIYDYDPTSDSPRFFEVPAFVDVFDQANPGEPVLARVTTLVLTNSSGSGSSFRTIPLQVYVPARNTNLVNLVLAGSNDRAVYFYRRGTNAPTLRISAAGGGRNFRIGMTLDGPADLDIGGSLTVVGGIRTDRTVAPPGGEFTLVAENDPSWKYDAIADRMMWLEDQRMR